MVGQTASMVEISTAPGIESPLDQPSLMGYDGHEILSHS